MIHAALLFAPPREGEELADSVVVDAATYVVGPPHRSIDASYYSHASRGDVSFRLRRPCRRWGGEDDGRLPYIRALSSSSSSSSSFSSHDGDDGPREKPGERPDDNNGHRRHVHHSHFRHHHHDRFRKFRTPIVRAPHIAKVLLLSDLHMDYVANREWLSNVCGRDDDGSNTMIVIAGDVSHDMDVLRWTLRTLKSRYAEVIYTPGNHELWMNDDDEGGGEEENESGRRSSSSRRGAMTSIDKLENVLRLCQDENVRIGPMRVGGGAGGHQTGNDDDHDNDGAPVHDSSTLLVIPLLSWHHDAFDDEPQIECWGGIPPARRASADYRRTIWPHPLSSYDDTVAKFVDGLNDVILDLDVDEYHARNDDDVRGNNESIMTFSHFLPRIELIPEKRYLSLPTLHSCVGSTYLERRLRRMGERHRTKKYDDGVVGGNGDDSIDDDDTDDGTTVRHRRSSHLHAFGHSHLAWDATIEGVRYVHVPLAYPREWKERSKSLEIGSMRGNNTMSIGTKNGGGRRGRGGVDGGDVANVRLPVCIWEDPKTAERAKSASSPSSSISAFENGTTTRGDDGFPSKWLGGWWSKYYAVMERQPHRNTELAPWAAKRFRQLPGGRIEDFDHVTVEERYLSSLGCKDIH